MSESGILPIGVDPVGVYGSVFDISSGEFGGSLVGQSIKGLRSGEQLLKGVTPNGNVVLADGLGCAAEGTGKTAFEINGTLIKNGNVSADMRKFTEYIFKDGAAPGKDVVYKNLGYSMENSEALTKNYIEQAMKKYKKGQYQINGDPTQYGQKINIEIELPGIGDAAGKTSYLKSGWMIRPDGSITLNTPFSGFTK